MSIEEIKSLEILKAHLLFQEGKLNALADECRKLLAEKEELAAELVKLRGAVIFINGIENYKMVLTAVELHDVGK